MRASKSLKKSRTVGRVAVQRGSTFAYSTLLRPKPVSTARRFCRVRSNNTAPIKAVMRAPPAKHQPAQTQQPTRAGNASRPLKSWRRGIPRRLHCRGQTKQQADHDESSMTKPANRHPNGALRLSRVSSGTTSSVRLDPSPQTPGHATEHREQQTFGQPLTKKPQPAMPNARRTAISGARTVARAIIRLARLAQRISRPRTWRQVTAAGVRICVVSSGSPAPG